MKHTQIYIFYWELRRNLVGWVAVDNHGNIAMPFNTEGMYRACKTSTGLEKIAIYK